MIEKPPLNTFKCLLCATENQYTLLRYNVRDSVNHYVMRCTFCNHVQLHPIPSDDELETYYRDECQRKSVHGHMAREEKRLHVDADTKRRSAQVQDLIDLNLDDWPNENIRILDIGCGEGFFVDEMCCAGFSVVGVDISSNESPSKCKTRSSYDVVTAFHVLEHVVDPVREIQNWLSIVEGGGFLVVEVPNHDDYCLRTASVYQNWYYQKAHLHYFTVSTLMSVLYRTGVDMSKVSISPVQRYGLAAHKNWLARGKPIGKPIGWHDPEQFKQESEYRANLRKSFTCDTLSAVIFK